MAWLSSLLKNLPEATPRKHVKTRYLVFASNGGEAAAHPGEISTFLALRSCLKIILKKSLTSCERAS